MVQEVKTPRFCSVCGVQLSASDEVQGFDPYTGDPVAEARLYCNNPTTETRNRLIGYPTVTTTYHPSWVNDNGNWQQLT